MNYASLLMRVERVETGFTIRPDPLELESLTWQTHELNGARPLTELMARDGDQA